MLDDQGKKFDVTYSCFLGTLLGTCVWDAMAWEAVVMYQLTIFTSKLRCCDISTPTPPLNSLLTVVDENRQCLFD
jgi:hypothetical protein